MPSLLRVEGQDNILMFGGSEMAIISTNPATGAAVTDSGFTLSWVAAPISIGYRIVVWETAIDDTVEPYFDTGYVTTGESFHVFGSGSLESGKTYAMRLFVVGLFGNTSRTTITITTNFASANVPTALQTATVGMLLDADPKVLPRILLNWTPPSVPGGYSFSSYTIFRSEDGARFYPVAIIASAGVSLAAWADPNVCSGHSYRYRVAVTWASGAAELLGMSAISSAEDVLFDHAFIHDVTNPSFGYNDVQPWTTFVRFESWDHSQDYQAEMSLARAQGRLTPTARFTEGMGRKYRIKGLPQLRTDRFLFERVKELITLQVSESRVLCLRLGRDSEIVFGNIESVGLASRVLETEASIDFSETFYRQELTNSAYGIMQLWRVNQ